MNSTDPTNAQFAAYRAMWAYFNTVLFGGALGDVILNFSRLARSLGFFAPERWRDVGDQVTDSAVTLFMISKSSYRYETRLEDVN